jgi:DNA-binding transcriptional MocR family regulator
LNLRGTSLESQTLRALLEMRELILRGAFRPGDRLREVPLAAQLNVSRTPLRLVLDRLAQEGLLKARPTGGFVASEFTVEDIATPSGSAKCSRGWRPGWPPNDPGSRDVGRLRECRRSMRPAKPHGYRVLYPLHHLNGQFTRSC